MERGENIYDQQHQDSSNVVWEWDCGASASRLVTTIEWPRAGPCCNLSFSHKAKRSRPSEHAALQRAVVKSLEMVCTKSDFLRCVLLIVCDLL